jgi:hypothetical protein
MKHYIWPIGGIIVGLFIITYQLFSKTDVLPYFIIAIFLLVVSSTVLLLLAIQKTKNWMVIHFSNSYNKIQFYLIALLMVVIFNSMFIVDRSIIFTNRVNSIYESITQEEIDVANFLNNNGFGTFDSFDYTLSTHIAALSGWYFIQDQHSVSAFLLEGIPISNISCQFTLFLNWPNMQIIACNYTTGRQILYNQLYQYQCYSIPALNILKKYDIRYFISSRHTNSSYAWEYTVNSVFIQSLYNYVPIAKITDNYYVWNTSYLYK